MTGHYGFPDDDDEQPPDIRLTATETADLLFMANEHARICVRNGVTVPKNPFSAVIEYAKALSIALASHDPEWRAEMAERSQQWRDRARTKMN